MSTNTLKMLTPDDLDRRTYLKGISLAAGAVVLQPFVDALAAEAAGKEPPFRVIFFMQGNGLWPHHVQPKGVDRHKADRLVDLPLADLDLPEPIAALEPFKDRLGIIQKPRFPAVATTVKSTVRWGVSIGGAGRSLRRWTTRSRGRSRASFPCSVWECSHHPMRSSSTRSRRSAPSARSR